MSKQEIDIDVVFCPKSPYSLGHVFVRVRKTDLEDVIYRVYRCAHCNLIKEEIYRREK